MALSKTQQQKLEQAKSSPYVRAALDMIAAAEGTADRANGGYNTLFGNNRSFSSYDTHPNNATQFQDLRGQRQNSTAAGRYQIIKPTFDGLAKRLGKSDFSPATQDEMAILLMLEKGALDPILAGDITTGINKLGTVWASLPSSRYTDTQPARNAEFVQQAYVNALQRYADGAEVIIPDFGTGSSTATDPYDVVQTIPAPPQTVQQAYQGRGGTARRGVVRYGQQLTPEFQSEVERILYATEPVPILPSTQTPPGPQVPELYIAPDRENMMPIQVAQVNQGDTLLPPDVNPFAELLVSDTSQVPVQPVQPAQPVLSAEERGAQYLSSQLDRTLGRVEQDFFGVEALTRPYADELLTLIDRVIVPPIR